jgi:hypothetical protein
MCPVDIRIEQTNRAGFATAISYAKAKEHTDRTTALIVTVLSLACTVLSIFDLFLLAAGGN